MVRLNYAGGCKVVKQTAGATIGRVHGTEEAPGLRQQLAHSGCFHLAEERPAMDASEVGEEAEVVDSLGDDGEAAGLWRQ